MPAMCGLLSGRHVVLVLCGVAEAILPFTLNPRAIGTAYVVMAFIVVAHIVMAYMVMAYVVVKHM